MSRPTPNPFLSRLLAPLVAAALILAIWLWMHASRPKEIGAIDRAVVQHESSPAAEEPIDTPRQPAIAAVHPTNPTSRQDIIDGVRAVYRKVQLTRELDLEQQRYATDYWKPDHNGADLAALRSQRATLLRELSEEATRVIAAYFPNEAVEPLTLKPLFSDDSPAPNLSFLSADSRRHLESELLQNSELDRARFDDVAARVLSGPELEWYRRWNDPMAAALRQQLVGFEASEREFNVLLQHNRVLAEAGEAYGSSFALEGQLGRERYTQLEAFKSPAFQSAVQDLNRAGIALVNADWLASTRQRAAEEIQQVWQSPSLSDAAKAQQVSTLQRQYGVMIDTRLGRHGSSVDEVGQTP
jgi:hypothetical protein